MNIINLPTPERPGEFMALSVLQFNTIKDGPAYVFIAVDAYSEYVIHLGISQNDNPETILEFIYRLTEHPEFKKHMSKGFTLVLEKYEELAERIQAIIKGVGGKLLIHKPFNNIITLPVIQEMSKNL